MNYKDPHKNSGKCC